MGAAHRLVLLVGLTLLSGCEGSMAWTMRLDDTPANWSGLQHAARRLGYKFTYERERELVTRRRLEAGAGFGGGDWVRLVAKRRGRAILFAVERWDRFGPAMGLWWTLEGNDKRLEKRLYAQLGNEPGVTLETMERARRDDGFLDEGTVEVPEDAPEYGPTEDFSLQ